MLDRFAGSEVPQFAVAALALGVVLAMIVAFSWLARRLPWLLPPPAAPGAIALRATLRLDARRRLHLVEVQGQHVLVLAGGATEVIIRLSPPAD